MIPIHNLLYTLEMRSLAELMGAYGVRHFSTKLVSRIIGEVEELKVSCWIAVLYFLQ